jgi:hypothetical protein
MAYFGRLEGGLGMGLGIGILRGWGFLGDARYAC